MKVKKTFSWLMTSVLAVSLLAGCGSTATKDAGSNQTQSQDQGAKKEGKIKIGVALPDFSDKWLSYLQDSMKKYAETQPDADVNYVDSQNDASKQMSQVETFIAQKVNAIVLLPVDTVSAPDIVAKANKAHIPIVVVNRWFDGVDKASAYVAGNSKDSGIMETEQIVKIMNGKGNVAIMTGQEGQEAALKRTEGTKEVIAKNPGMHVVLEGTASWDRAKAMSLMENWLHSGKKIDAVIANNDEMAIGALMAAKSAGKDKSIVFAGIDATPDALKFVQSGELKVTVFQDAQGQGEGALKTAIALAKGDKVQHDNTVPYQLVTKDNAEVYVKKWEGK
jgi:inositol transport system substrate-binding protein